MWELVLRRRTIFDGLLLKLPCWYDCSGTLFSLAPDSHGWCFRMTVFCYHSCGTCKKEGWLSYAGRIASDNEKLLNVRLYHSSDDYGGKWTWEWKSSLTHYQWFDNLFLTGRTCRTSYSTLARRAHSYTKLCIDLRFVSSRNYWAEFQGFVSLLEMQHCWRLIPTRSGTDEIPETQKVFRPTGKSCKLRVIAKNGWARPVKCLSF